MHAFDHIIFRGDESAYARRAGRFPYVDHAAAAGATGVHIWFWGEPWLRAQAEFVNHCHARGLTVHLGLGVGAYGVCDGQDPTDPGVRRQIQDHIGRVLDEQAVDGIEFQMGEYDWLEYKGESARGKPMGRQVIDALNPMVEFALQRKPSLWVRTELWMIHFDEASVAEIARDLDPRCIVEWSDHTGPFRGEDRYQRGRELLALDESFSWFLKLYCDEDVAEGQYWQEHAASLAPAEVRRWIEAWRPWLAQLHEFRRPTLTILVNTPRYAEAPLALPALAAALARNPSRPAEELLAHPLL